MFAHIKRLLAATLCGGTLFGFAAFGGIHSASAEGNSALKALDDLVIMTEDYPPFNFRDSEGLKGVSTEIMREILRRTGRNVDEHTIELLPWARGYQLTLDKPGHALFSTTRTASREALFKWVGPFVPTVVGLIAKKERKLTLSQPDDLHKLRIGVVKDDIGHLLLKEIGMPEARVEPVLLNEQNYKKLFAGRIDAIAYETNVSNWRFRMMGINPDEYEVIYKLKSAELYLALHKDTPDAVVTTLQKGLDSIKEDGTYQSILQSYGLAQK
ncbi:MAG: ABC transporter substrate-binding protein [Cohaesibacter sp.]|jgi:polar amino acid transport system substrate-binding protein|nr:ABC transporter substrate-binding protein [Cohaesibacter sp.]